MVFEQCTRTHSLQCMSCYGSRNCLAEAFVTRLNSRQRTLNHGTNIFEAGTVGMNVIARVNRRAEVERWDVPEVGGRIRMLSFQLHDADSRMI